MKAKIIILLLILALGFVHCRTLSSDKAGEEEVEVTVKGVTVDLQSNSPVVVLEDSKAKKLMPIWIGVSEARAIATELEDIVLPRPMTHDLMKNLLVGLDASLRKIVITELKNNTFYAVVYVKHKRRSLQFDARPSDAIALALRFKAPIYVKKNVLESAQTIDVPSEFPEGWQDIIMGFSAQDLSEDLLEAMDLKGVKGVLVSDVRRGSTAERDGLMRGDIIISAGDKPVSELKDLIDAIASSEGRPMSVRVLREGKEVEITLHPGEGE